MAVHHWSQMYIFYQYSMLYHLCACKH